MFVLGVIGFILLNFSRLRIKNREIVGKYSFACNLDNEKYSYEIEYNSDFQIINAGGDSYIANHTDIEECDDANKARAHVEDWFKEHNGLCIVEEK